MKIIIKKNESIYFLLMILYYTNYFWGNAISYVINQAAALMWIFYYFTIGKKRDDNYFKRRMIGKHQFYWAIIPYIVIDVYSVILWICRGQLSANFSVFTRMISSTIYLIMACLIALFAFRIFGKRAINIAFCSAIVSYIMGSVIGILIKCGPITTVKYLCILDANGTRAGYIMEVHDITFAFGLYAIYYLLFENKNEKSHMLKIVLSFLMVYWGLKRIEIAAILICLLIYFLCTKNDRYFAYKSKVIAMITLFASYIFIFLIHSNKIVELASKYGINFSGRLGTWKYMIKYSSFSPTFMGLGYQYVDKTIEGLRAQGVKTGNALIISGLHSDTLKLYMELGFLVFTIWIIYMLFIRTSLIRRKIGVNYANVYLILSCYMFILYLTDNVYAYYSPLMTFLLICMSYTPAEGRK